MGKHDRRSDCLHPLANRLKQNLGHYQRCESRSIRLIFLLPCQFHLNLESEPSTNAAHASAPRTTWEPCCPCRVNSIQFVPEFISFIVPSKSSLTWQQTLHLSQSEFQVSCYLIGRRLSSRSSDALHRTVLKSIQAVNCVVLIGNQRAIIGYVSGHESVNLLVGHWVVCLLQTTKGQNLQIAIESRRCLVYDIFANKAICLEWPSNEDSKPIDAQQNMGKNKSADSLGSTKPIGLARGQI